MNKIYTKRDSATAALRKMGVLKGDYNKHIKKLADGRFELVNPSKEAKPAKAAPKGTKIATKTATSGSTVSSRARELILAGKENADVFATLKAEFNLDDSKKHYPSWYRSEMRRSGALKETGQTAH